MTAQLKAETYRLVGGPSDGELRATGGIHVWKELLGPRIPLAARSDWWSNDPFKPSFEYVVYYRVGNVYRWEGLVEDAWADMDVSDELWATGGPMIRREVRRRLYRRLVDLAPDKELGRIVWRVVPNPDRFTHTIRAFVGPRAVEFGLEFRADRT